jgi:hypothetical protein
VVRRGREATTDALLGLDDAPGLFTRTEVSPQPSRVTAPPPDLPTRESAAVAAGSQSEPSEDDDDWGLDDDAADYSAAV